MTAGDYPDGHTSSPRLKAEARFTGLSSVGASYVSLGINPQAVSVKKNLQHLNALC